MPELPTSENPSWVAGYVPVIHRGYIELIDKYPRASVGVFDHDILEQVGYLRKDIRALDPNVAADLLRNNSRDVVVLGQAALANVLRSSQVAMPDDDITRHLRGIYPGANIIAEPIFLRWDRDAATANQEVIPDDTIKLGSQHEIVQLLGEEMAKSSNWWRHVGAVLSTGNSLYSAHNSSLPTQYTSLIDSDPRITAQKGENIDRSIDIHAEARVIADCAREGIATENGEIYVSTFPCPNCAKIIAESGIKTCYYFEGYASVDGYSVLKDYGVHVVRVTTDIPKNENEKLIPYRPKL